MLRIDWILKWNIYRVRNLVLGTHDAKFEMLNLGRWLKNQNYVGVDSNINNLPQEISTVYGLSMVGWINLYKLFNRKEYLAEAKSCLEKILSTQSPNGAWLFPYPFRDNPPNFPYACEIFMTIESLFRYLRDVERKESVVRSIREALSFLVEKIGYEDGIFWYSPKDKVEVPNISSMAANVFTKAHLLFDDTSYLRRAETFANYCINNQDIQGAFPYYGKQSSVDIAYHALETWELIDANKVLNSRKVEKGVKRAIEYLGKQFYDETRSIFRIFNLHAVRFKTPLWAAKAFLMYGDYEKAFHYFREALRLFRSIDAPSYFYSNTKVSIGPFSLYRPSINFVFMRINASCFEIGSELLPSYLSSPSFQ